MSNYIYCPFFPKQCTLAKRDSARQHCLACLAARCGHVMMFREGCEWKPHVQLPRHHSFHLHTSPTQQPSNPHCHFPLGWNNTESLQSSFDQRGKENSLEVTQQPHEGKSPTNLEQSLHTRDENHSTRVTMRVAQPCPPPPLASSKQ